MADTTDTKRKLKQWTEEVARRAFEIQLRLDTDRVPRGDSPHADGSPKLSETRQVTVTDKGGTITYPTMIANYLEEGTGPHVITARVGRALVFVWPAGPAELSINPGTSLFAFKSVNHPGSTIQQGWFTTYANEEQWERSCKAAASEVQF